MKSSGQLTRAELLRRAALGGAALAVAPAWLAEAALGGRSLTANGNKRRIRFASDFTRRVGMFPRTAYLPTPGARGSSAVAMVIDELLVGAAAAADAQVTNRLAALGATYTGATVFQGLAPAPAEDVQIWRLGNTPGAGRYPDVAEVVWDLRRVLVARHIQQNQVAPNHVLVPANWHTCPWSPPEPPDGTATLAAPSGAPVDVVVIDSGYIAQGPIVSRIESGVDYGEWFTKLRGGEYGWVSQPREVLDTGGDHKDGRLDTLAGHAGFVAGVIAQASPRARITVVNHNGAFVEQDVADTPIPTEASVARSLWNHRNAAVINVGFAFATLPSTRTLANSVDPSGPPSWTLGLALRGRPRSSMLVAPAGNQGSRVRQYPAAFSLDHPNVAGVGSLDPRGGRSVFSNHGPWVACCTEGEEVLSSFVTRWRGRTEDPEPPGSPNAGTYPVKDFTSGWALWSGTSFAAPKMAGAIAQGVGPGMTPLAAWTVLKQSGQPSALLDMGVPLKGLPPT